MYIDMLTVLWLLPLAVALILLITPIRGGATKIFSVLTSLVVLIISTVMLMRYERGGAKFQFVSTSKWLETLGISYKVGVDGIALLLVVLTSFLIAVALFSSFKEIESKKGYYVCMLILESALIGTFISLDLILFFIFWEGVLIPMYLVINWYGSERRVYAATKFIIYTMVGSAFLLSTLIYIGVSASRVGGGVTFDYTNLKEFCKNLSGGEWRLVYIGLLIGFLIKLPAVPVHTWLPDAHTEAPTGGSVILAGILLKMGGFGLIRYCIELFPIVSKEFASGLIILGVVSIFYGGVMSYVQKDIKRLIAYSSVCHMGYVLMGCYSMNEVGMKGAVIQMISHGLTTGGLFLVVGMLYERMHTRDIEKFGGLAEEMKNLSLLMMIIALSALGLPGLSGFVGEFLSIAGVYKVNQTIAFIAAGGALISTIYILWFYQKIMFGEKKYAQPENPTNKIKDLTHKEYFILVVIIVIIIVIGIDPSFLMKII